MMERLKNRLLQPVDAASVAVFRICFGFLVPLELLHYYLFRPFLNELYFNPAFHFKYQLFGWVPDLPGTGIKLLVLGIGASFIMMGLGFWYKITRWTSFLGFSWLFLMERASFLNHWYMVCLFCFLLLFIPANAEWSLDTRRNPQLRSSTLPAWCLYSLVALLSIIYFYSGFVKINGDWLAGRQMEIYLSAVFDSVPDWWPAASAYGVMFVELIMVPLLLWKRTRIPMFVLAVLFHLTNSQLFTVGLFPFMMIAVTTIYFEPDWPRKILTRFRKSVPKDKKSKPATQTFNTPSWVFAVLAVFFVLQLLLPLRSFIYKGNQLWTEEGLTFSWKMMLEAKTNADNDAIIYWVKPHPEAPLERIVPREHGLTWAQENKLVRNPDLILQFAYHIGQTYDQRESYPPKVYVDAFLGMNGRPVQRFIHPNVDLYQESRRWVRPYPWVMPLLDSPNSTLN